MPLWPSIAARGNPPERERVRVELRPRTYDDIDACELLAREVHDVDGYPPRFADDLRGFVSAVGALAAWVAASDGAIVGHVALQPTSSPAVMALAGEVTGRAPERLGVVARLLVAPAHRRKGLGGTLLGVAAQAAHDRGRWPILDVAVHFHAAIGLYERSGWVRAGRVDVPFRDAEPLAEYVYIGPTPRQEQL
jgi:GNAT superfamily N-acetyltransferase